jgi:hypothetical protein
MAAVEILIATKSIHRLSGSVKSNAIVAQHDAASEMN